MVALGTFLALLATVYLFLLWRKRDPFESTWLLRAVVVSGPAAIIAMETGWITTEVGRQPWIVHNVMRTEDAVTDAGYIWFTLAALVIVYAAMTIGAYKLLRSMSRRWREGEKDLASPYGPSELTKEPAG